MSKLLVQKRQYNMLTTLQQAAHNLLMDLQRAEVIHSFAKLRLNTYSSQVLPLSLYNLTFVRGFLPLNTLPYTLNPIKGNTKCIFSHNKYTSCNTQCLISYVGRILMATWRPRLQFIQQQWDLCCVWQEYIGFPYD